VRGAVKNTIALMKDLEAVASRLRVFIGPGVGDRLNEFQWDEAMEHRVQEVFVATGREDLLTDSNIRYRMSEEECEEVRLVTGRETKGGTALMLETLIIRDLMQEGVTRERFEVSEHSTIYEKWPTPRDEADVYRYHSSRRDAGKDADRPGFGVKLCVLFLEDGH
jgi:copper oxidase (laccase) domain-containing protein